MARGTLLGIRRYSANGVRAEVDSDVLQLLDELNTLLSKRILPSQDDFERLRRARLADKSAMGDFLSRPLAPRRSDGTWAPGSLAEQLNALPTAADFVTLEEWVDAAPRLAELKYEVLDKLDAEVATAELNAKLVLDPDRGGLVDYLLAVGFYVMGVRSANGMMNFLTRNERGVANVVRYAAIGAGRAIVTRRQLKVAALDDDAGQFASRMADAKPPLADGPFTAAVDDVVDSLVFDATERGVIEFGGAELKIEIPPAYMDRLVRSVRQARKAGVQISNDNIINFLPLFIAQAAGESADDDESDDVDTFEGDFDVNFLATGDSRAPVNTAAVKCAAQLFYARVLGDELRVFDAVDYFTRRYLLREDLAITDKRLRDDLQLYVFSDKFSAMDPTTNRARILDRSRPDERAMFYRQVFAHGRGETTEDMIVNEEFPRLWKVLMYESAQYLERARESLHPETFVSAQGVQQAVEDIQYNLSVHCTGMANVMTPLLYDELRFVTQRILSHPDVVRHVAPTGGTWLRAVERLHTQMTGGRPRATVLNNKAEQGHHILREIAGYQQATFVAEDNLMRFLSHVDGFIISQSILQDSLRDSIKRGDRADEDRENTDSSPPRGMDIEPAAGNGTGLPRPAPPASAGTEGSVAADDWNF